MEAAPGVASLDVDGVQQSRQVPQVLAGMEQIDDLNGSGEVILGDVLDPLGAVTTLLFLWVGKFLARPRLVLSFDGSSDAYVATSTHREGKQPSVTRKYLRVSLRAAGLFGRDLGGSSGAANCLIYITAIQRVVNGSAASDEIYDGRTVSWPPNGMFDPRHIPRGITMFANVVTMKQGHLGWNFHVPDQYGLDSVRSHAGILRFHITATAENAKPVSIYIEASIKADLSGFQARLVRR